MDNNKIQKSRYEPSKLVIGFIMSVIAFGMMTAVIYFALVELGKDSYPKPDYVETSS